MRCTENDAVFGTAGIYTDVTIKLCAATKEDGDDNLEVIAWRTSTGPGRC